MATRQDNREISAGPQPSPNAEPATAEPPTAEPPDAALVAAVLAGEREEFAPLVARYQGPIFGYLYRLLDRDRDAAQDLTQSVFLKAYQGLASYQPSRPLAPWLYRIAHNEAANLLRTRARHPLAGLEEPGWEAVAAPGAENPETRQAAAQERELINQAIAGLNPKQREAVMLYYFEERGYEEISEIMGLPPGTVATLIRRGRKQLARLLEKMAPGVGP